MGEDNQQNGNNNTNTTKEVRNTTNKESRRRPNNKRTDTTTERPDNTDSQLFVRPRTPPSDGIGVPVNRQKGKRTVPFSTLNKHKLPKDQRRSHKRYTPHTTSIPTRIDLDSKTNGRHPSKNIHDHINRRCVKGTPPTAGQSTTDGMVQSSTTSMDQERHVIILHHIAQGREEAQVPQRAIQQRKTPIRKRKTPESLSDEEENQNLLAAAEEVEQNIAAKKTKKTQPADTITPSSSTRTTKQPAGNRPTETSPHRASSPSTTAITTTSSTQAMSEEETSQDSVIELVDTLVQQLQDIQKSFPQTTKFVFSGDSFNIASVTVSRQRISMALEAIKN